VSIYNDLTVWNGLLLPFRQSGEPVVIANVAGEDHQ
jgi:hypothetical protein